LDDFFKGLIDKKAEGMTAQSINCEGKDLLKDYQLIEGSD